MKYFLAICLILAATIPRSFAEALHEQDTLVPKQPEKEKTPTEIPEVPSGDPSYDAEAERLIVTELSGLIIVKSFAEVQVEGAPPVTGLEVRAIEMLETEEFANVVEPYFGKEVRFKTVKQLERDIILYCRKMNTPIVDVILPEQTVTNGVLQLLLFEAKTGRISVQNEGVKWFPDKLILRSLRLDPGAPIDSQKLAQDLEWLNRNPFRQSDVVFKQGSQLGETDVAIRVQDRFPFRFYAGYEDTGTKFTGENRLLGGVNWGNAFGQDQQLNYQYTTAAFDTDLLSAHSANYSIPLPWRHTLTFFGSYVDSTPRFIGSLNAVGHSWQISPRYGIPLPAVEKYQHELTLGFDFKSSNNNLLFGNSTNEVSISKSDTHIAQFMAGYNSLLVDPLGQTVLGGELYLSPGYLTGKNEDANFDKLRTKTAASYCYLRLSAERVTHLPYDCSWVLKAVGQFSTARLLPSEELGLGGYNTVRGYEEREVSGDEGWFVVNELRSPSFTLSKWLPLGRDEKTPLNDQFQFLAFMDYGKAQSKYPQDVNQPKPTQLWSVGAGFRFSINPHVSIRADYGWQLKKVNDSSSPSDGRGHVGVLISF